MAAGLAHWLEGQWYKSFAYRLYDRLVLERRRLAAQVEDLEAEIRDLIEDPQYAPDVREWEGRYQAIEADLIAQGTPAPLLVKRTMELMGAHS